MLDSKEKNQSQVRSTPYSRYAPLLLLVVSCIVYANSLDGEFIYDDIHSISTNPDLRRLWPPDWMLPTDDVHETVNSRPVASFTLALNYAIGGLEMPGYRLFNLAVHIFCGLALYGVVRRTLHPDHAAAVGLAFSCALLWLVHPLHSQCVNYIIQRRESLASLFYLLALYGAIRGIDSRRRAWYIASILFCALGVASKEIVVTAPFAIALYDRVYRSDSWSQIWRERRYYYLGFGAPLLLLVFFIWGDPHGDSVGFERVGVWQYALNQCVAITHYLLLMVWPYPLLLDYGPPKALTLLDVAWQALLVIALLLCCGWGLVRYPRLAYPGVWFFVLLAPSSSVVPIVEEWAAERRVYLASAGPLILVLLAAYYGLVNVLGAGKRVVLTGSGLVLCTGLALGAGTLDRNRDYRSALTVWEKDLAVRPDNMRALRALAFAHEVAGNTDTAIDFYQRSLQYEPNEPGVYFNLGLIYARRSDWDAAIEHYRRAVHLVPHMAQGHNNLALAYKEIGRLAEALAHFRRAIEVKPDYAIAHKNIGSMLGVRGEMDTAAHHLVTAARLQPDDKDAHFAAGTALRAIGQWQEAVQSYRQAVAIDPGFAVAHLNLGVSLEMVRDADAALAAYEAALEAQADFAGAAFNIGRLLEDKGRVDEAITRYERAVELNPNFVEALSNLGLAYQHKGQVDAALACYRRALAIRPDYVPARTNLELLLRP